MFNHPYLLVVAAGFVAALWTRIRSLAGKLASRLVVAALVNDADATMGAVLLVALQRRRKTRLGTRVYRGGLTRIRPLKRVQVVAYEVDNESMIYWIGRWPLFVTVSSDASSTALWCYWLRGTIDFDALCLDATNEAQALTSGKPDARHGSRFYITRVVGRSTRPADLFAQKPAGASTQGDTPQLANADAKNGGLGTTSSTFKHPLLRYTVRPVGWDLDDLVAGSALAGSALDRLALSPAVLAALDDVREWAGAREWYEDRDIPHRHGVLFYGPPGCGKTRTVAALGQDLNMPVISFDMASLSNSEFLDHWGREVRNASPCIALFEDIDAVFDGRENVTGREDGLTFDCFLNALGGVEVADGVLVIITTNKPETLDPAIARVGEKATRPGRIEAVVELGPPDAEGRRKIAVRVMADCLGLVEATVDDGAGESGAQFLDRCRRVALSARRRERNAKVYLNELFQPATAPAGSIHEQLEHYA